MPATGNISARPTARRSGALMPATCRLSRWYATGPDLLETRREPAFEGFLAVVTRPQWLEQAAVGCLHKPRQRPLRTPTEAVVGQIGVRNRRVSVQSVMNARSGERHALNATVADGRSVLCGCPARPRTGRAVHCGRRRSSGWGTGSPNACAPAARSSPQGRTAVTACRVSRRCCENSARKHAAARTIGESRVPVALVILHSARCSAITGRHREKCRGRMSWE